MDTACTTTLLALADRSQRYDGWTPDRQRAFLEAIAEGHTVASACALVGMAQSSAYALRRRAAGAGFALGWRAATLLAREKVVDTLLARAIDGQVETLPPRRRRDLRDLPPPPAPAARALIIGGGAWYIERAIVAYRRSSALCGTLFLLSLLPRHGRADSRGAPTKKDYPHGHHWHRQILQCR